MKTTAILEAGIIFLILAAVPGSAAAADSDIKFYAAGDPIYISGNAPGAESTGLAVWIIGPNYWSSEYFDTETGGSYIYEIEGGLTGSLSAGQYFVVIQHPMYNGAFDVDPAEGVPSMGRTSVVSTAGGSFIIDGRGKLQGSAAAYALMNLLDSQNIDDTYTVTTFYLDEPWIRPGNSDAWPAGSVIRLEGTTNIAPGEKLTYTFYPESGDIPSSKQSEGTRYTTEMAGQLSVEYGMPENTWTVDIDTEGMDPGKYIFTLESPSTGSVLQAYVALYEPVETAGKTAAETETAGTAAQTETSAATETFPVDTPQAPLSLFVSFAAPLLAVAAAAGGRFFRRG